MKSWKRRWVDEYNKYLDYRDEKMTELTIRVRQIERMLNYLAAKVFENED